MSINIGILRISPLAAAPKTRHVKRPRVINNLRMPGTEPHARVAAHTLIYGRVGGSGGHVGMEWVGG